MFCFVLLFVFKYIFSFYKLFHKNLHLSSPNVIHFHNFSSLRSLQTYSVSPIWVINTDAESVPGNIVQLLECLPYRHETTGSIISTTHTQKIKK